MTIPFREFDPEGFEVKTVTGAVRGASSRTETTHDVRTSGGSGGVYVGNVRFDDPVRSASSTKHSTVLEFFLETEEGKEVPVRVRDLDLQVRDGHVVSLHTGTVSDGSTTLLAVSNHTTDTLAENIAWELDLFNFKPRIGCLLTLGVLFVLCVASLLLMAFVNSLFEISVPTMLLFFYGPPIAFLVWRHFANKPPIKSQEIREVVMKKVVYQKVDAERRLQADD